MRWFSMSTRLLSDPKVERLGEVHGPVGPLVWTALLAQAGAQEKGGKVEMSFRTLSHEVFSDVPVVEAVLSSVEESHLCHTLSRDVHGFEIELKAWAKWQAAGRKASERSRKKEANKPAPQADVTGSHTPVTDGHTMSPTRQGLKERDRELPTPNPKNGLATRVCAILQGGLDGLSENDFGREWPTPKLGTIASLVADADPEFAVRVAEEVRRIVQAADRAPNVTALYEQKFTEAKRENVREVIAESLGRAQ